MQSMWVAGMEKEVDGAQPPAMVQKWPKHCIFRVPRHFMGGNVNLFKPQMVALGPFHHGDDALLPMEKHKLRAVQYLLRRAGKTLGDLATAVEGVAVDLEDAYAELGSEWRGENRDKFLHMMIADGCFLLEFMRNYTVEKKPGEKSSGGYSANDPVFGPHAMEHTVAFILRDMLLIENQLPLILLRTIVAVESGQTPSDSKINKLVLKFLCKDHECSTNDSPRLGLHALDLYRRSLLQQSSQEQANGCMQMMSCCRSLLRLSSPAQAIPNHVQADALPIREGEARRGYQRDGCLQKVSRWLTTVLKEDGHELAKAAPRSAQKLYEAGIWFKHRKPHCLNNIHFKRMSCNVLEMPRVTLDDSTEYKYRNLMAFEALHAGAGGNDVTAFVLFMRDLVDSKDDVELLRKKGILDHCLAGGDQAVVSLLNDLTKDVAEVQSKLCHIRKQMDNYCTNKFWVLRVFFCKSWAKLRTSHLANIWTLIALLAAIFMLGSNTVQTVYTVMSYFLQRKQGRAPPPSPPPHGGGWAVHY